MQERVSFLRENASWLGAGTLLMFASSFGQTYFISLFAGEIRAEYGLSHGAWGTLYAVGTMASAALMLMVGGVVDGHRTRSLATLNLIVFAAVCLGMALSAEVWLLPFLIFGLRFCGQGMMTHLSIVSVGRWFRARRGQAISITSMGYSIGEAILPFIFVSLIGLFGWRQSWVIATVVLIAYIPLFHLLLRQERSPRGQAETEFVPGMDGRHWRRSDALRHWLFWAVLPGFLCQPAFNTAFFFQQVHLAEINDWSLEGFAGLFPLYTASSLTALFFGGWAVDRWGVDRVMPFYLLPLAIGFTIVASGDRLPAAALGMLVMGATQGMSAAVTGSFWPEYYGTRHLGSIRAVAMAVMVFATGVGPAGTGLLIDLGVSFDTQLLTMALIFLTACCGFWLALARAGRPQSFRS